MAVSQFLRPGSLLDAVNGYLTPELVRSASTLVGEPEAATRRTLNGAVPSLLSGLTSMASTREGAADLAGLVSDGSYASVLDNISSLFSGGSATSTMRDTGTQLLGKIFRNRT